MKHFTPHYQGRIKRHRGLRANLLRGALPKISLVSFIVQMVLRFEQNCPLSRLTERSLTFTAALFKTGAIRTPGALWFIQERRRKRTPGPGAYGPSPNCPVVDPSLFIGLHFLTNVGE